jgi:hypothetical protein
MTAVAVRMLVTVHCLSIGVGMSVAMCDEWCAEWRALRSGTVGRSGVLRDDLNGEGRSLTL